VIDLADLALVLAAFNSRLCPEPLGTPPDPTYNPDADFNGNLAVDLSDLSAVLARWNQACP
jgi:hypothetical protein